MIDDSVDIVVFGGGLASSLLAINLLKKKATLKIVILEKNETFNQKWGESTSDIAAIHFKALKLDHLLNKHTIKTGLRFLFDERKGNKINQFEFASPTLKQVYNGYHFDRKTLDEDLLLEAEKRGVKVYRPMVVKEVIYKPFQSYCAFEFENQLCKMTAKWLVDATGRARFLHQKLGWKDIAIDFRTMAITAHFDDIKENAFWDMPKDNYWEKNAIGSRALSTIHFLRKNSWWWLIRINNSKTSIGVVLDKNHFDVENPEALFWRQIKEDEQLSKVVEGAVHTKIRVIDQLAYVSEQLFDKGVALIGESGAFTDPMVSPGIELICQQAGHLSALITEDDNKRKWEKYNRKFQKAYLDRIEIYKKGYQFMDSYDLFSNWLRAGNWLYIGLNVFPLVAFPRRKNKPFTLSRLNRFGMNYLYWRLTKMYNNRDKQKRISSVKSSVVSYSGVRVPKGITFYFVPLEMLVRWLVHYFKLEIKELFQKFK